MTQITDPELVRQVSRDEGRSAVVYKDTKGLWTIGDGILVDFRIPGAGLDPEEMDFILQRRLFKAATQAMNAIGQAGWLRLADTMPRLRAVINMTYNLGGEGFKAFQRTINAIRQGDWEAAAVGMENSLWYKQVGHRGERLVKQMRTGIDQL